VGLAHAGLKPQDKQAVMTCFAKGELNVLVATTVVEVGVDVPNATLIVIENPERLGLAQLHQLRGRVGRATAQSYCVLMFQSPLSLTAKRRLTVMRQTQDGFVIAEEDLSMRGPGDVLGVRQSGLLEFKVANLIRDKALISQVQLSGQCLLKDYPQQAQQLIGRWVRDKQQLASV
jgi:ATP-dependent DNA helicase RecG